MPHLGRKFLRSWPDFLWIQGSPANRGHLLEKELRRYCPVACAGTTRCRCLATWPLAHCRSVPDQPTQTRRCLLRLRSQGRASPHVRGIGWRTSAPPRPRCYRRSAARVGHCLHRPVRRSGSRLDDRLDRWQQSPSGIPARPLSESVPWLQRVNRPSSSQPRDRPGLPRQRHPCHRISAGS